MQTKKCQIEKSEINKQTNKQTNRVSSTAKRTEVRLHYIFLFFSFSPLGEQENQCSDFGAFGYVCVPNWQCRSEANYTINKGGIGLIAPRNQNNRHAEIILPEREVVLRSKCDKLVEVTFVCLVMEILCSFVVILTTFLCQVCCQHPEAFSSQRQPTGGQREQEIGGCEDVFQNCNGPEPDLPRPGYCVNQLESV